MNYDEFDTFVNTDLVYDKQLISIIDNQGRQIYLSNVGQLHSYYGKTIKLEHMEYYGEEINSICLDIKKRFKHKGFVTCHVFRSYENSHSFPEHVDNEDVLLYVIEGQKQIETLGKIYTIEQNQEFFIPKGQAHRAINNTESLMFSFGLEKFYSTVS